MREYLAKNSKLTPETESIISKNPQNSKLQFDPTRYRVRMYFNSSCPHCKKMFQTLASLQNTGVYVEALQVDNKKISKASYPIPIRKANPDEIKAHKISAVPFTLIADLKKKAIYPPVRGYKNLNQIINLLNKGEKL